MKEITLTETELRQADDAAEQAWLQEGLRAPFDGHGRQAKRLLGAERPEVKP
jgi:hypothetical protein